MEIQMNSIYLWSCRVSIADKSNPIYIACSEKCLRLVVNNIIRSATPTEAVESRYIVKAECFYNNDGEMISYGVRTNDGILYNVTRLHVLCYEN